MLIFNAQTFKINLMKCKHLFSYVLTLLVAHLVYAQNNWEWNNETAMPFAISNNAVCEAYINNSPFLFSFSGIDTSKIYSGISNRSFKFNITTNMWQEIDPLPDSSTKIAAGASFVNGKIYIIGGYTVLQSGNEISSNKVHVYDPITDPYLDDGADIPIAIDDHVQCTYKDSLIYVVTGWSNTTNVNNVQIYDTYLNTWQQGTATPNGSNFKVFGASGSIMGDTLYYLGGARIGNNFPLGDAFRKGYINPQNPTEITWSHQNLDAAVAYRQACINLNDTLYFIGGSKTSYNYNGVAYNGSGGVEPSLEIIRYIPHTAALDVFENAAPPIMDLRGIAKTENKLYLAGGMNQAQIVSENVYSFTFNPNYITIESSNSNNYFYWSTNSLHFNANAFDNYTILDLNGSVVKHSRVFQSNNIDISSLKPGSYILKATTNLNQFYTKKFIKH